VRGHSFPIFRHPEFPVKVIGHIFGLGVVEGCGKPWEPGGGLVSLPMLLHIKSLLRNSCRPSVLPTFSIPGLTSLRGSRHRFSFAPSGLAVFPFLRRFAAGRQRWFHLFPTLFRYQTNSFGKFCRKSPLLALLKVPTSVRSLSAYFRLLSLVPTFICSLPHQRLLRLSISLVRWGVGDSCCGGVRWGRREAATGCRPCPGDCWLDRGCRGAGQLLRRVRPLPDEG